MYSSTVSTQSTAEIENFLPFNQKWELPTIDNICLEGDFYKPKIKFNVKPTDDNKLSRTFFCKNEQQHKMNPYGHKEKNENIKRLVNEIFLKDTKTFDDILKEERIMNKEHKKINSKIKKCKNICCVNKDVSFIERIYCFPRIVADLGHDFIHYKTIAQFVRKDIKEFHFDLRFATEKLKSKLVSHMKYARKIANAQHINGLLTIFCSITGRNLQTGENKYSKDIFLDRDSKIILTADRYFSNKSNHKIIYVNFHDYVNKVMPEDIIEIGNEIKVQIKNVYEHSLECTVLKDGLLKSHSGIKLPTVRILDEPPKVTFEEKEDIMQAFKLESDFVIIPYPFSPHLINFIHWMSATKNYDIKIYAKINLIKSQKFFQKKLSAALEHCDGIYVYLENLTNITQPLKTIFTICLKKHKSIFWGGIFDKEESIKQIGIYKDEELKKYMFLYPEGLFIKAKICNYKYSNLKRFIKIICPDMNSLNLQMLYSTLTKFNLKSENAFLKNMIITSLKIQSSCIIITNNSGETVSQIARCRLIVPIITSFNNEKIARRVKIFRNIYCLSYNKNPISFSWNDELEHRLAYCTQFAKEIGILKEKDQFIFCFDSKRGLKFSDSYRILCFDTMSKSYL